MDSRLHKAKHCIKRFKSDEAPQTPVQLNGVVRLLLCEKCKFYFNKKVNWKQMGKESSVLHIMYCQNCVAAGKDISEFLSSKLNNEPNK